MKTLIYISIILTLVLLGCTSDSILEPEVDLVVIRGYLYADEPVTDIQITSTLPLGSDETSAPPITDAPVYLIKNEVRYDLIPSPGDSGCYHYPGEDLMVNTNDIFKIYVEYFGTTAYGQTQVPTPPNSVDISGNTLYVPEFETREDMCYFEFDSSRHVLTITWEEDPSSLFFVVIENKESDPDSIETFFPMGGMGAKMGRGRFISEPSSRNDYAINYMTMSFYGEHLVTIYRVNQEYSDLYISRQQDSRDLNEPLTNIENGLGVFSAFNSVSFSFQVVRE